MGEIKLLDCTLRDGGYVNDWNFGHDNLISIFERVIGAGTDIIEVGFLDERRPFDINRSIMPDTESVSKIWGNLDKKETMVLGMIDYGTCSLENIQPCESSYLDGIRVIFKKHLREQAIEFCGKLKALGYKVFAQLVSITSYNDEELLDLVRLANEVKPYAVSIVDTYGLLHQDTLMHYFTVLNDNLDLSISLGYHSHNNFQLGYANCIEMLSHSVERDVLVDATIYGMGKSAGNTPIELLSMHLNEHYGKNYQISQFLEAIDANIMNIYRQTPWGYNMFYYVAAANDCHPNYVSYLMEKRTLSVKAINEILAKIEGEKKLLYDEDCIEALYVDYQAIDIDDKMYYDELGKELKYMDVLLLGTGPNLNKQIDVVTNYINEYNPIVISINFIPEHVKTDFVFLSNSKRYVQLATALATHQGEVKVIATSNVTKTSGKFDYTLNYSDLLDYKAEIADNSIAMLLQVLIRLNANKVALAGFDGYKGNAKNYIHTNMEYDFGEEKANKHNKYMSTVLKEISKHIQLTFITDTLY